MVSQFCAFCLPLNRDTLEQGRKVTDTHRNPQTKVYRSKNSLKCLQSLTGKPVCLGIKLDFVLNNRTGPYSLKSTITGVGVRWPRAQRFYCLPLEDCPCESSQSCGFPHCPWRIFVISIFSCTMLYCYRKNPICQQFSALPNKGLLANGSEHSDNDPTLENTHPAVLYSSHSSIEWNRDNACFQTLEILCIPIKV